LLRKTANNFQGIAFLLHLVHDLNCFNSSAFEVKMTAFADHLFIVWLA